MGDEPDLPLRAQLAPYLVGGPWIFMGDLPGWSESHRATIARGVEIYRAWRTAAPDARAVPPALSGSSADVTGLAYTPRRDGSQLVTFAVAEAGVGKLVRWHPVLDAGSAARADAWIVRDEWSGAEHVATRDELELGILLDTASADGLALSVRPA